MGRGFKAERKKWPSTRFFVTAALFHTRNKVQTLRFAFSRRIIIPCSLKAETKEDETVNKEQVSVIANESEEMIVLLISE
jgi:hypothetical protein